MPIMDIPEVPPAVHVQVERHAERGHSDHPIGAIKVTVTAGLVDTFLNNAKGQIVKSAAVPDEGDPPGSFSDEGGPPTKNAHDEGEPPGRLRDEGEPPDT